MTNSEQRDWIWERYEQLRDMSYDMATADVERLTREAAEKLLEAHRALVAAAKEEYLPGVPTDQYQVNPNQL